MTDQNSQNSNTDEEINRTNFMGQFDLELVDDDAEVDLPLQATDEEED